jgi:hypothetical protein
MANKKSVSLKIGTHKSRSGGLTAAGRAKYNKATGSNLKAPQPEGGPVRSLSVLGCLVSKVQ